MLAFQLPSYLLDGRHSIRPSADADLLSDDGFVQLAPLLSPVLPMRIRDNDVTKHLTGETRMKATIDLMVQVVAAKLGAGRPVIVFEDVHWMDSSSWAVLRASMAAVQPLLVLLTLRPLPEPARSKDYTAIVEKHKLCDEAICELERMGEPELHDLICEQLGVHEIQSEFLRLLAEKSGGNPFWALEFVRSMREDGVISTRSAKCELLVPVDKVEFPSSVEALITARMDRLPAGEQLLMKMASVMGATFSTIELKFLAQHRLVKLDIPTGLSLEHELDKLCAAEMLARDPSGRAGKYMFKHKYLQDVSYLLLPEELKFALHRAAAEYFEHGGEEAAMATGKGGRKGGSKLQRMQEAAGAGGSKSGGKGAADLVWKLSYHWSRAGDAPDAVRAAVRCLTTAGDEALSNFSLDEARKLLEQALGLTDKSRELQLTQRGPLQRRIAQCHLSKGEVTECRSALNSALIALGGERPRFLDYSEAQFAGRYWQQRWSLRIRSALRGANPLRRKQAAFSQQQPIPEEKRGKLELAVAYELLAQVCMLEHQREQRPRQRSSRPSTSSSRTACRPSWACSAPCCSRWRWRSGHPSRTSASGRTRLTTSGRGQRRRRRWTPSSGRGLRA